tara:strand:+ start:476 stop:1357 length:882 start_codon:yes stop_codon:yes gene_type:complete
MNLITLININKKKFDLKFKKLLKNKLDKSSLSKAMLYGSMNGGKRIRPFLVIESAKIAKISSNDAFIIASCIECIHSYSLIHDDLPSMDNDDFRRGKLSTHKKFNEATAILAGDALHDLAFELISSNLKNKNDISKIKLINYLSLCIGYKGLALGQALDLEFENKKLSKNQILDMYSKKTGKLFEFSFASTFILKNKSKKDIQFAKEYGMLFGLIYQVIDDLIDEIGTFKKIGKTPGKDIEQGKSTLLELIGEKKVTALCKNKINNFKKKYNDKLIKHSLLMDLLEFGMNRIN